MFLFNVTLFTQTLALKVQVLFILGLQHQADIRSRKTSKRCAPRAAGKLSVDAYTQGPKSFPYICLAGQSMYYAATRTLYFGDPSGRSFKSSASRGEPLGQIRAADRLVGSLLGAFYNNGGRCLESRVLEPTCMGSLFGFLTEGWQGFLSQVCYELGRPGSPLQPSFI